METVLIKEIGTRRAPFEMKKASAERMVARNPKRYEIINSEPVKTIQKKSISPLNVAEESKEEEKPKRKRKDEQS